MSIVRLLSAILLLVVMPAANAAVQASLDRDHVALGDSITLTIASDASGAQPELAPLRKDFDVRGTSTSSQTTIVNGSMRSSVQWSVALVPKHAGAIDIPALAIGSERTQPIHLAVGDAPAASTSNAPDTSAASGAPVFIETAIDQANPYVQQAMVYTVRLYYAVTLLDGALDAPTPDNGDLRQIGDDATTSVVVQGRRYNVLERHYLLQPEHSGSLHVPGPAFHGRAMGDADILFDDGAANGGGVRAAGKPIDLQVRARPAQAGDPWIPARGLRLSVDPPRAPVHAGEPFSIVVRLDGEGVTASQLPEIALPAVAGAQVYPEPSSTAEQQRDGRLLAERTRRFAIVPDRSGALHLPGLTMAWWDVGNDRAALARATLPTVDVLPAAAAAIAGADANAASGAADAGDHAAAADATSAGTTGLRAWKIATACLAALLALSLWWGWQRGRAEAVARVQDDVERVPDRAPTLSRALALGEPSAIAQALLEAAPGMPPRNLVEVAQRLQDPAQRDAVLAFDAARWGSDAAAPASALALLRAAFRQAPRWAGRTASARRDDALPPLYPS